MMVTAAMAVTFIGCSKDDDHKQDYNPLIDDPKTEEPTKPSEPGLQ